MLLESTMLIYFKGKVDEIRRKCLKRYQCYENSPVRFTEKWFKSFLYVLWDIDLTYDTRTYWMRWLHIKSIEISYSFGNQLTAFFFLYPYILCKSIQIEKWWILDLSIRYLKTAISFQFQSGLIQIEHIWSSEKCIVLLRTRAEYSSRFSGYS